MLKDSIYSFFCCFLKNLSECFEINEQKLSTRGTVYSHDYLVIMPIWELVLQITHSRFVQLGPRFLSELKNWRVAEIMDNTVKQTWHLVDTLTICTATFHQWKHIWIFSFSWLFTPSSVLRMMSQYKYRPFNISSVLQQDKTSCLTSSLTQCYI